MGKPDDNFGIDTYKTIAPFVATLDKKKTVPWKADKNRKDFLHLLMKNNNFKLSPVTYDWAESDFNVEGKRLKFPVQKSPRTTFTEEVIKTKKAVPGSTDYSPHVEEPILGPIAKKL